MAWSDANFNAVGWNADPLNPLALLILSLAGGLPFDNRSKGMPWKAISSGNSAVCGSLRVSVLKSEKSQGKGTCSSSSKDEDPTKMQWVRGGSWHTIRDFHLTIQGELNTH